MSKKPLNEHYGIRVNHKQIDAYKSKCKKLGVEHSKLTREMQQAVVEGRMKITPTKNQSTAKKELYDVT